MPGNKNSGRKSRVNEEYRLQTIEECWAIVRDNINNEDLPLQFRIELAAKHTVKSIPTELAGQMGLLHVVMGHIEIDGKKTEFNIGSKPEIENDPSPEDTQPTE